MVELISTFGLGTVVIVLLIAIPAILGVISYGKKLWQTREQFKQENIEKGRRIEALEEEKEARLLRGETRMDNLENDVADLKLFAQRQQELIELLIRSDELDIKSWIKTQHEKWIPRQCIDSQTLELLEQRYAIYTKEGGNSWAEKLVKELRALPTVTVVAINDIHEQKNQD